MNCWASFLRQTPPTLQRLIASSQRISLPRQCPPHERLARLRAALCRPAAVRAVYFTLTPAEQQALQELRAIPYGLSAADLATRFGAIRPLAALRTDRAPRTISERLLLLGWLLPRPATRNHPTRYLLAPELRAWLPVPLRPEAGVAIDPAVRSDAPALRAATAILVTATQAPLALRADGRPTAATLRMLRLQLPPLPVTDADALCAWLLPLLGDLGLLAPHGAAALPGPAATRFLTAPPAERLRTLNHAWVRAPRPDRWLTPMRVNTRGLDWPALRRRLLAWAEALPDDGSVDPAASHDLLQAALGPLADSTTHGLCVSPRRSPWLPRRAAEVWAAACHGPLCWLGALPQPAAAPQASATTKQTPLDEVRQAPAEAGSLRSDQPQVDATSPDPAEYTPAAYEDAPPSVEAGTWSWGAPGMLHVPQGVGDADLLIVAPFTHSVAGAADGNRYALSVASVAAAAARGHDPARLRAVLLRRCAVLPLELEAVLAPAGGLRMIAGTLLLSDQPADLAAAMRRRSVRRAVAEVLAPGVALVAPGDEVALARALARDGRAVASPPDPATPLPAAVSPAEQASLLLAAAHYRATAPEGAPPGPHDALLERLRAGLPPALGAATDAALAQLVAGGPNADEQRPTDAALASAGADDRAGADQSRTDDPQPPTAPPLLADLLGQLRAIMRRRGAVTLRYQGADDPTPRERTVRPLRIERHGPCWYLHAYCLLARAERCFRLDRVLAITPFTNGLASTLPRPPAADQSQRRLPQRLRSAPQAGFFAEPPAPPAGSVLVRVWLDDGSDQPVGRLSGDLPDPVDRDALDRLPIQPIAADAVGVWVNQIADLAADGAKSGCTELALEDAVLDPRAVALEQLHHLRAPLVADNIVADDREHGSLALLAAGSSAR